ncbi:hypothetical protein WIW50_11995 [Flavobacteriaceae bacterium 3-367]|uniref:hypothetical protein n=1 Tax=Eudoraea algarum TaxID=3417568 RepID=UPI00326859B8
MYRVLIVFIMILVISCKPEKTDLNYKIAYKNDREGNTLMGSKEALIKHIRGGAEIKIGWGFKGKTHSIEHLSEPIWIAVLDETEVIAHLDAQVLSKTDWDKLTATYADSTLLDLEWRVVLTTKGEFDAIWYDRNKGTVTERRPQKHTITWFVKSGVDNSEPLFSN